MILLHNFFFLRRAQIRATDAILHEYLIYVRMSSFLPLCLLWGLMGQFFFFYRLLQKHFKLPQAERQYINLSM